MKGKNHVQTSGAAGAVASAPRLWRYWGSLQPGLSAAAGGLKNCARPHQPGEDKGGIALAWSTGWRCLLGFRSDLVLGLLPRGETIGTKFHLAENRLYVTLQSFIHPVVIRMAYPHEVAASIEASPVQSNNGIKVNVKTLCVLLHLFSLKPEEPVAALFRQKAA